MSDKKTLDQEKKEQKFLFQFVNHENGERSEPFISNWDGILETLHKKPVDQVPSSKDYILLVAVLNGEETTIPATPLITVESFMKFKEAS